MGLFDRVSAEAQRLEPLKLLLTILAAPFFLVGWLAGKVFKVILFVVGWAWAAVKVGWADARSGARGGRR